MFPEGQTCPHFKERGPGFPPHILGPLSRMRNRNQILHGDQTRCEVTRSTTPSALTKIYGDTNADERSVCGS